MARKEYDDGTDSGEGCEDSLRSRSWRSDRSITDGPQVLGKRRDDTKIYSFNSLVALLTEMGMSGRIDLMRR